MRIHLITDKQDYSITQGFGVEIETVLGEERTWKRTAVMFTKAELTFENLRIFTDFINNVIDGKHDGVCVHGSETLLGKELTINTVKEILNK